MSSFLSFRDGLFFCLAVLPCAVSAQAVEAEPAAALSYRESIVGVDPMSLSGVESRVASILRDYYEQSFGGSENWEQVESFRFEGVLRMPQGELSFVAFKKKPDCCKIVLFLGNGVQVVMSFDGEDAWHLNTAESSGPSSMPPLEALNFIRDATTGGQLLYPALEGKRVELLGTRVVEGRSCYDLRVTLPNGQQISHAIDRHEFVERQQIAVNAVSGATEVTTHGRIEEIHGVSMPMQSTMVIGGEFAHEVQVRSVEVNRGVVPWMFARPSGIYVPGRLPEVGAESLDSSGMGASGADLRGSGKVGFGVDESAASVFDDTLFPDLDAAVERPIVDGFWGF